MRRILWFSLAFSLVTILSGSAAVAATTDEATLNAQARRTDSVATSQGGATVSGKLSAEYSTFAGSLANADSLVNGLRNGKPITLTSTDAKGVTTSTTFTPPTGKMGYGNVNISLAMARQDLANNGITQPTPQQLQTALMGGSITTGTGAGATTTNYPGVLQLRSQSMGWGQIAHSLGFKLGPVISSTKATNTHLASKTPVNTAPSTTTATTASGSSSTRSQSGMVTGAGTPAGGATAHGVSNGSGAAHGQGIVSGTGAAVGPSSASGANAHGIVTGAGAPAGRSAASGAAHGQGIVSGTGAAVGVNPANGAANAHGGIVTGAGTAAGGGSGNAYGRNRP